MAQRASEQANEGGRARKGNGFDPEVCKQFIDRIENLNADIASQKASNAKKCREISEDRDGVFDEAKNAGIPKNILKAEIKKRDLLAQVEALREKFEGDEQDLYDNLALALGDLGKAAADQHKTH